MSIKLLFPQLVCEEVNVDRFYPVLYPKVSTPHSSHSPDATCPAPTDRKLFLYLQASRLIVTFDEHVISNNFKFGVIYQKFGQVSVFQSFGLRSLVSLLLKMSPPPPFFFNFPRRRLRRSCLGTWRKALPLSSSWSFWATRSSFMTLKGLNTFFQ